MKKTIEYFKTFTNHIQLDFNYFDTTSFELYDDDIQAVKTILLTTECDFSKKYIYDYFLKEFEDNGIFNLSRFLWWATLEWLDFLDEIDKLYH